MKEISGAQGKEAHMNQRNTLNQNRSFGKENNCTTYFCFPVSIEEIEGSDKTCFLVNYKIISSKMVLKTLLEKVAASSSCSEKFIKNPLKELFGLENYHIYSNIHSCFVFPKLFYKEYSSYK